MCIEIAPVFFKDITMPKFEKHCEDCIRELGKPFEEVHRWLDELFAVVGSDHRDIRHNVMGIEKVRKMWGDQAAKAAEIHVVADEGKVPEVDVVFKMRMAFKPHIHQAFLKEYDSE